MTHDPKHKPVLPDVTLDGQSQRILDEFRDAWRGALSGGTPPELTGVTAQLSESERIVLGPILERLHTQFSHEYERAQSAAQSKETSESSAAADTVKTPRPEPEATAQFSSPDVLEDPLAAQPSDVTERNFDATVDLSSKPNDDSRFNVSDSGSGEPLATIDSSSPASDQSANVEFSWDPHAADEDAVVDSRLPLVKGYRILGELGRGGMGVVYRAKQRGLNRIVALKMILAGGHAGPEQLARFRLEAEAVAHLQHPNIVQIYDVGEQDGLPFFSLEYVDGYSLEYQLSGQPQVPRQGAKCLEQIARGMHYAHQQGIIHRDLKPANILLTADGVPKVTDFGLVKRLEDADSGQTRTGTIMGTPSYMAPEQGRGAKDIGPAADVYALGSMLYTMLTGRPPFLGATPIDTLSQLLKNEPVPPSRLQPKIPVDLETICLRCLQKDPPKRYESAGALADDLGRYLNGEPIAARPVGRAERLWRWCRRNPRVAIPTSLAGLLALAMMIGGPIVAAVIYQQKQIAVDAQGIAERESQAAQRAETIARENADIAKEQRVLALDTLNKVVTEVEQELRDRADLNDLRHKVLDLALEGLDQVSRTDENASLADRNVGAVHQRIGDILLKAGKSEEAFTQFKTALQIFDKLLEQDPDNDLARWNAALCCDGMGDVRGKQLADAVTVREYYLSALEHRKILEERGEQRNKKIAPLMMKASLVNSNGRLGKLSMEMLGDPQQAVGYFEGSLKQSDGILNDLKDHPVAKQAAAGSWFVLGQALFHLGRDEEANGHLDKSQQTRQELLESDPQSVKAQQDMAVTYWLRGDVAMRSGDVDQALRHYLAAHELRQSLFDNDPKNPEMHEDLGHSFYRVGTAHAAANQEDEATRCFAESMKLRKSVFEADPENPGKELQLILSQARCGQVAEAIERTDEFRTTLFPNPGTLFALARSYALCAAAVQASDAPDRESLTQQYLDQATELLDQAVANGHRDPFELNSHPDLVALGDR